MTIVCTCDASLEIDGAISANWFVVHNCGKICSVWFGPHLKLKQKTESDQAYNYF